MIRFLRRAAAVFLASCALGASASTTFSPDYTDAWITPGEAGHGVFMIQNGTTIFLAMYVYGGDTLPRWYYASSITPVGGSTTNWSGTLYRSQGTSFASPWNPGAFQQFSVGTISLIFTSPTAGTISYTVDNIAVTQSIQRFAFFPDNLAGVYLGGLVANVSSCSSAVPNGYLVANRLTVQHTSATPVFIIDFAPGGAAATCTFQGTYTQLGRLAAMNNGTWSCTGAANNTGTFSLSEIEASRNGFSARFSGKDQYCGSIEGYFGGIRDVQ
jgi:hypothetical protein